MTTESSAVEQTRAAILRRVEAGIAEGPFRADWDSLTTGYRVPDWYVDGKFGIFIHWGPYSVPAYSSEWYPREMYRQGTAVYEHHRHTYGPQREFGYKDFIPQLTGSAFDPAEWASLFRRAGAQFVVPVCRAPRRFRHVRDKSEPMERGTDGSETGRDQGAVRCRSSAVNDPRRI